VVLEEEPLRGTAPPRGTTPVKRYPQAPPKEMPPPEASEAPAKEMPPPAAAGASSKEMPPLKMPPSEAPPKEMPTPEASEATAKEMPPPAASRPSAQEMPPLKMPQPEAPAPKLGETEVSYAAGARCLGLLPPPLVLAEEGTAPMGNPRAASPPVPTIVVHSPQQQQQKGRSPTAAWRHRSWPPTTSSPAGSGVNNTMMDYVTGLVANAEPLAPPHQETRQQSESPTAAWRNRSWPPTTTSSRGSGECINNSMLDYVAGLIVNTEPPAPPPQVPQVAMEKLAPALISELVGEEAEPYMMALQERVEELLRDAVQELEPQELLELEEKIMTRKISTEDLKALEGEIRSRQSSREVSADQAYDLDEPKREQVRTFLRARKEAGILEGRHEETQKELEEKLGVSVRRFRELFNTSLSRAGSPSKLRAPALPRRAPPLEDIVRDLQAFVANKAVAGRPARPMGSMTKGPPVPEPGDDTGKTVIRESANPDKRRSLSRKRTAAMAPEDVEECFGSDSDEAPPPLPQDQECLTKSRRSDARRRSAALAPDELKDMMTSPSEAPEAPAKMMPPPPDVPEAPAKEMPPPEAPAKKMPPLPDVPEGFAKEMPPPEEPSDGETKSIPQLAVRQPGQTLEQPAVAVWTLKPSVGTWISPAPPELPPFVPDPTPLELPPAPPELPPPPPELPPASPELPAAPEMPAKEMPPPEVPQAPEVPKAPEVEWFLRPSLGTWLAPTPPELPPAPPELPPAPPELPPAPPELPPAPPKLPAASEMPAKEMPPPEVPQAPEAPAKEMPPPPDVPEAPAKEMPPPEAPAKEMPPPPDVPEAPAKEMPPPEEAAPKAARPPSRPTPTVFSTAGDSILYAAKGILGKLPAEQTEEEELKSSREATDKLFKADFWGMESLNTPDAAEELAFARRYNELRPIATAEESAWQDPVHGRKWGSSRPSSSQVAASEPAPSRAATAPAAPPQPPRATKNDAGAADQEIQKSAPPQAPVEAAQRHWIFAEDDEETEMPSDDAPRLPAIESVSSPSTSVDFASRGSLLQRSKSSPIGREGSLLPELGDEASREDLKSRLALEIDLHMQTVDHVKELERKLRIANAAMKLPPGRRMPKRFGVSDARAYAVAPPAPERIPSPRRSKKAGGVYLPSIKPFPAQKSEERPQEKLEAIADKARAAALSPQQSRSTGFSKQEALVPAVKSAMRHERSQTRLEAISMLDSRGMNTWDVRKAEKVARFQDLNVFSESMWSSFHKWQDDATAPT